MAGKGIAYAANELCGIALDLQLKRAEIKRSCALPKSVPFASSCAKPRSMSVYQRDRYIQLMMPGENSCNVVLLHALNGVIEKHRILWLGKRRSTQPR